MKVFTAKQIAEIDRFTIEREPITDIDLMERASMQVVNWLIYHISNEQKLIFLAGPGNNGGDAMAVARMMAEYNYCCELFLLNYGKPQQGSPATNWQQLEAQKLVKLTTVNTENDFPDFPSDSVIIDGLFGSGLNRTVEGLAAKLIAKVNESGASVVAIDIPSGLFSEDNSANDLSKLIRANYTLTFQFPKLSFFFSEHEHILDKWEVLPIGLHPEAIRTFPTNYFFTDQNFISEKIKPRSKFSHKGTYGHALLIAGSYGKMGAAILASRSCLRTGIGLLTTHVPNSGYPIIQTAVPEAMSSIDPSDLMFTEFPDLNTFTAVGAGPGLGTKCNCQRAVKSLLQAAPKRLILDADALNILSENKEWLKLLPPETILTPHPKEFERLTQTTNDSWSRLQLQLNFSAEYKIIVVLKGAHTCITFPDGRAYFNTTGNPGMATAGSGDVLTGIILSLLAQNYSPEDAALTGVYLHGLAGDLASAENGQEALIAGDITEHIGKAFGYLQNKSA